MFVTIGIDPHKSTHTAVAVDRDEHQIGRLTLAADRHQTDRLLAWAEPLDVERVWAIESAAGLGRLLARQLIAAAEHVVDVPPTLTARVRLLGSSKASKNNPNDAFATAIAGLRHCGLRTVTRERSHCDVLGHVHDVSRFRTRAQFASYNGTAPIEAFSANRQRHRLNPRDNRQLNHAIHIIAVTQVGHDTPGHAYYLRRQAEGKTRKRSAPRTQARISDAVWRQ